MAELLRNTDKERESCLKCKFKGSPVDTNEISCSLLGVVSPYPGMSQPLTCEDEHGNKQFKRQYCYFVPK